MKFPSITEVPTGTPGGKRVIRQSLVGSLILVPLVAIAVQRRVLQRNGAAQTAVEVAADAAEEVSP